MKNSPLVSSNLDPRTKLLLITIAMVVALGNDPPMRICRAILVIVPFVGLISLRRVRAAGYYLIVCLLANMVSVLVLPQTSGVWNFLLVAICVALSRMMPGLAMGWYLLASTASANLWHPWSARTFRLRW